jgi:predicted NBD/HSP70 family sugar kinase
MKEARKTPNALRALHDSTVYRLLAERGAKARAEITAATGISKPTVLDIIERLCGLGLVEDAGVGASTRPGPRARLYRVCRERAFGLGVEVHARRIDAELHHVDGFRGGIETVTLTDRDVDIDDVIEAVRRVGAQAGVDLREAAATIVSTGGGVHPVSGRVLSWDLPQWRRNVSDELGDVVGGVIEMENETNLRAVAEHHLGAARDVDNFALISLGAGIGAGLMHEGRLYRGRSGLAGEIGYLPVPTHDGTVPLRDRLDGPAIRRLAAAHGIEREPASAVAEAVRAGRSDAAADAFLDELADRLAGICGSFLVLWDPERIVLADEVGVAGGEELAGRVARRLAEVRSGLDAPATEVRASQVRENAIRRGAMSLLASRLHEHVLRGAGYPAVSVPRVLDPEPHPSATKRWNS